MSRVPAKGRRAAGHSAPTKPKRPREKVAHRVAREIVRSMYEERMAAGDKYFSEAEAIERYGVSRGTLREALRFLQLLGVLDIRQGLRGGHFVAQPDHHHLASTLALLLQFSGATMVSLIDARSAIEPGMAELAATHATQEDVENIDRAIREMDARIEVYVDFHDAYMRFWNALAVATRNPLFMFLSPALREITHTARVVPTEEVRARVIERARGLRDAVAANDPAAARIRMVEIGESYRTAWRTAYAREGKRIISWADVALED